MLKKKPARRKVTKNKKATKRPRAKAATRTRKAAPRRKPAAAKPAKKSRTIRGTSAPAGRARSIPFRPKGPGAETAGQSGDIEGLRKVARANSESVEELAEEGQSFEADVVAGVEEAEDAEESEVVTHEVPEDDVPSEYDDNEH
jgi:hypothetical protein